LIAFSESGLVLLCLREFSAFPLGWFALFIGGIRQKIRGKEGRSRDKWSLLDPNVMEWQVAAVENDELFIRNFCEVRPFLKR
jgi:hypothetical protein